MTNYDHINTFAGLAIHNYASDTSIPAPSEVAVRLALDWEDHDQGKTFEELFSTFLADPASAPVRALVIGDWGGTGEGNGSEPVVEALVSAREKLPNLRALFLGEMTMEESEISWINQSDVSPLFEAFPQLEYFYIRGGAGLSLGRPRHQTLRELVVETGGMSGDIVREVTAAQLPALEHLELWLGDDGYGNDVSPEDIAALLSKGPVAHLKYLGLRDDCHADATVQVLVEHGIPASVKVLDLSLGVLTDDGAKLLAECDWIKTLKKLDIHFHYVSPPIVALLQSVVQELDASDPQPWDEDDDGYTDRYVAVSE